MIAFFDQFLSMIEIIYGLIALNILFAASTAYFWRRTKAANARPESIELQEFLTDLLVSGAMIHVRRVNPNDIVIRQRRGQ